MLYVMTCIIPVLSVMSIVIAMQSLPALAQPGATNNLTGSNENFVVEVTPSLRPIAINQIHSWLLTLHPNEGSSKNDMHISVSGGMPLHAHGMQTTPKVAAKTSHSQYQVDGMKFHMRGYWEVAIKIDSGSATDEIVIAFNL